MRAYEIAIASTAFAVISSILTGCTAGAYQPGVERLAAAADAAGPLVSTEAETFRNEYRISLLRSQPLDQVTLGQFVCQPLGYTAEPLGSSAEVSDFGRSANAVANVPEKPTLWDGLFALFKSYKLPVPKDPVDLKPVSGRVLAACDRDTKGVDSVNNFLIEKVGTMERSTATAISGILEIIDPAATEALSVIDDHRRAEALRDFFDDKMKVSRLRDHVKGLEDFFLTMDEYRRLRAMEAVKKALAKTASGADDAQSSAVEAAKTYDAAYGAQLSPVFKNMGESIDDLEKIANGGDEETLIRSSYTAAARTLGALEGIMTLTHDKDKKEKLQQMINQLLHKKPKAAKKPETAPQESAP